MGDSEEGGEKDGGNGKGARDVLQGYCTLDDVI